MYTKYEYNKTVLSAQAHNNKVTIELPLDLTLNEFLEACRTLAIGITFTPETWKDAILTLADEYREDDEYRERRDFKLGGSMTMFNEDETLT
jgi:hypothetical protein